MDRKEHILNSAETLVRSRGFDGFSYADIEREVGIRKASIHHHFSSKADLALALIERYDERFMQRLDAIRTSNTTAGRQLTAYLDAYRQALGEGATVCLCVAYSAGRDSLSPQVLKRLNAFNDKSIAWLITLFDTARVDGTVSAVADITHEATAALALVEGAQLVARAAENTARFDAAVAGLQARVQ